MKKIISLILAVTLTTLLSGCGIKFGVESRNNNNRNNFEDINNTSEEVNIVESMEGVTKLNISIDVSNTKINYYDGSDIEVSGRLSEYSKGIKMEKSVDKIDIIEESKRNGNFKVNGDYGSNLSINIPKNFNGDIELSFGVGEFQVNDLELSNFTVKSGVGEVYLNEISFDKLNLESGVGSTTLETSKKTGEIDVEGGIGETNIILGDINGNLNFDGGMGSASIKVPVDAPININTNAGLGESRIKAKTSSDAKYDFDIKVGIGEIEVIN